MLFTGCFEAMKSRVYLVRLRRETGKSLRAARHIEVHFRLRPMLFGYSLQRGGHAFAAGRLV